MWVFLSLAQLYAADESLPYEHVEETTEHFRQYGSDEMGYYSQYGQDRYVYENFFKGKTDGVFVDIGAHNGIAFSNSKFFEDLGWKGVCVEPIPEEFNELKKNRSAICIQGCISNVPGKSKFWRITGPNETLSGLIAKYDPRHVSRIRNDVFFQGGSIDTIDVDCYLLNDVLNENGLFHIDYLSIDTEGGELDILKSIDFSRFDIEIIDVEDNYGENFTDFLNTKGYLPVENLFGDKIYQKNRSLTLHKLGCIEEILSDPMKSTDPSYQLSRTLLTIQGEDADSIPKVPFAGQIFKEGGLSYQLMHNGVKIIKDCYYDVSWLTDIITGLKGHHEPQEEKIFYEVLKFIPPNATMIELGAYWGYYSLWFSSIVPGARNYLVEPDPRRLNVGRKNFELNGKDAHFYQGYAAIKDNDDANFSGARKIWIDSFLKEENIDHVHILHADIQGAEYAMLNSCIESIKQEKIDYFFISTHLPSMHLDCLNFLKKFGYQIVGAHTPAESCSGDGLIVARRIEVPGPENVPIKKYFQ